MVKRRVSRVAPLLGRKSDHSFSKEELHIIPQLLQLLRSGALSSLLPSSTMQLPSEYSEKVNVGVSASSISQVEGIAQKPSVSPVAKRNPKSKEARALAVADVFSVLPSDSVEWKSLKRISSGAIQTKDKLLSEGWSVPVKDTVRDLSVTAAGVCLASTSDARKAMAELKGTQPLGILAPANIDGQGQDLHVLVEDPSGRCHVRRRFVF